MSRETLSWLNNNTLIGFTEKRGTAWHYRAGSDNHYPHAVPVEDVRSRLFDWTAEEHPLYAETGAGEFLHVPGKKAIVRSDTSDVLGIFSDSYVPHQYGQWLVENVSTILDDDLLIGSAGLLRRGAVAWVSVEMPDNIVTPEGFAFRPFLMARTSFDGSVATTYGRHITAVVCDNTMAVAAGQHGGQQVKVRHTSKSMGKLAGVRDALGIVHSIADDFSAQVAELTSMRVTPHDFDRILDTLAPPPEKDAKRPEARIERREKLVNLYLFDPRVAPWTGTAFGVWQAFNTYGQHEAKVHKVGRAERNMERTLLGKVDQEDDATVRAILELVA